MGDSSSPRREGEDLMEGIEVVVDDIVVPNMRSTTNEVGRRKSKEGKGVNNWTVGRLIGMEGGIRTPGMSPKGSFCGNSPKGKEKVQGGSASPGDNSGEYILKLHDLFPMPWILKRRRQPRGRLPFGYLVIALVIKGNYRLNGVGSLSRYVPGSDCLTCYLVCMYAGVQQSSGDDGSRRGRSNRGGRGGRLAIGRDADPRSIREGGTTERAMRYNRREQRSDEIQENEGFDEAGNDFEVSRKESKAGEGEEFSENLPIDGDETDGMERSDEEQFGEESQKSSPNEKKRRGKKGRIGVDRELFPLLHYFQFLGVSLKSERLLLILKKKIVFY